MTKRKFSKEFMKDVVWGGAEGAEVLEDNVVDTSRWSVHHDIVFSFEGKNYRSSYSEGATEMQMEDPYENDPDEIEVTEVEQVEVKKLEWKPVGGKP